MGEVKEFELEMAGITQSPPPITAGKVEALVALSFKYLKVCGANFGKSLEY